MRVTLQSCPFVEHVFRPAAKTLIRDFFFFFFFFFSGPWLLFLQQGVQGSVYSGLSESLNLAKIGVNNKTAGAL